LYESIAACYYNIVSLQEQINITTRSLTNADSVLKIVKNKYDAGIVREQDVNNASINQLIVQDKLVQLKESLQQQYNSLRILCDIPAATSINITDQTREIQVNAVPKANSSLLEKQVTIQSQFLKSELRSNNLSFAPTVSVIFNQGWQMNSNEKFFDNNARWIPTQYIGLRVSMPFPLEAAKLSQSYTSKINWRISELNAAHNALQNKLSNEQINSDYVKALSSYNTNKAISELKSVNYQKSVNQYREGILSTETFLTAFTDKLTAGLNATVANANLKFTQAKININNKIQ
jgi:outer membrane protein